LLFLFVTALTSARKYRLISFCLLWFLGNLAIESSFLGLELIFEHRNYLPSMMLILLAVTLILPLLKHSWLKIVFLSLIVLTLSLWTYERNRAWNDRILLWGDSAAKSPAKARPHNNLGVALKDKGQLDSAVANFKQTIQLDPKFTEAYNNLGNTYMLLGKHDEALKYYRKALDIAPKNPLVHANLGNALVNRWQLEEALFHYGEALRLNPEYEEARQNFLSTRRMIEARKLRGR
jgi:tetratricopeptide (TPR) repeat protein